LNFETISIRNKDILNPFFHEFGENSCQHSFAQAIALQEKYGDQFCIKHDILFILRSNLCTHNKRVYLFPFCKQNQFSEALNELITDAATHQSTLEFKTITENACKTLDRYYPGQFQITEDRDYAEYLYLRENLVELSGHKLMPKRNRVRAFKKTYDGHYSIKLFGSGDSSENKTINDLLNFQQNWLQMMESSEYYPQLQAEDKAIKKLITHYVQMNIKGLCLYVNDAIVGFTFGAPLSDTCIDEIAEKGNSKIIGVYQILNYLFALEIAKNFTYINREEDLGLPGLRRAKLGYDPKFLKSKYVAKFVKNI